MRLLSLIILTLLSFTIRAQDNYMSLSFGASKPLNCFAMTDDILTDGYAHTGFMADYSGAYYPLKYLGFAGNIRFSTNGINFEEAQSDLLALIPVMTDTLNTSLEMGVWNTVSLAVGPQFTITSGDFNFDIFLLGGFDVVAGPKMDLTAELTSGEYFYTTLESQKLSLGFETGASIRYFFSGGTGIRIFSTYQQTSAKGELRKELDSIDDDIQKSDYKTSIQMINFGIGLIYQL